MACATLSNERIAGELALTSGTSWQPKLLDERSGGQNYCLSKLANTSTSQALLGNWFRYSTCGSHPGFPSSGIESFWVGSQLRHPDRSLRIRLLGLDDSDLRPYGVGGHLCGAYVQLPQNARRVRTLCAQGARTVSVHAVHPHRECTRKEM